MFVAKRGEGQILLTLFLPQPLIFVEAKFVAGSVAMKMG